MKDDTKQNERKKQISSPDDAGAYTFHPVTHSNIDKPTRNRPHCRVLLLDGQYHIVPVDKKAKAVVVLNELFRHLELKDLQEKEFFSVYYVDISGSRIFLNPFKQIRRQLPNATSRTTWDLFFGVQFYATELGMLADEMTRYLYVLQMCRDIKEKRINADHATKLKLVSLLVQANCGDYDPQEHKSDYVEPYIDMIYNPADIPIGLLNSVHEVHKEKTGLKPNEADDDFFMTANSLYKFGQQIFPVHDRLNQLCEVGASIVGLFFHKDGKEFMNIPWGHVVTVGYRNKKIRIRYHPKGSDDHVEEWLYLYCSRPNAKLVWRGCVEQHTFFRLERPTPLVKNATKSYHSFNRNSELRFSRGRTLYQMLRSEHKQSSGFQRSLSFHFEKKPARDPSTSIQEEEPKPAPKPDKSPTPSPSPGEPEPDDISNGRRPSIESETLQDKIEKALSEKHLDNTDSDQTETDNINVTVHVEINHSGGEEDKSDGEGEQKQNDSTSMESDVPALDDQNDNTNLKIMKVEITKSNPDLTNVVEFSGAEKNNSSFMVTLEETSPSPPPDNLKDRIMFEGNYRSDSIITNDFGPVAQYLLEKSNLEDGTVTATAVDIEVRTPTPTYDETKTEFMEQELIKEFHVDQNPEVTSFPAVDHEPKEDEEGVFVMRSKLYQYDTVSLQWKEKCGVGNVQILRHKKKSTYRVLMKREATDTVCANHQLTANSKLLPLPSTNCAWEWNTQVDHTDNEAKSEKIALRFRSAENAMKFKEAFEKCQAELRASKTSNYSADGTVFEEDEHTVERNITHYDDNQSDRIVTVTIAVDDHENI